MASVIAQRTLTGEFLDFSIPIADLTWSRELSGPGGVFGGIDPALLHDIAPDGRPIIEEWGTSLFVVEDGEIRAGGMVSSVTDDGPKRAMLAPGYNHVASEQPFLGNYVPDGFPEPTAVYRMLWNHLQSFPDGNIGMLVDAAPTYMVLGGEDGPFRILETDYREVAEAMETVLTAASIEWVEEHAWVNGAPLTVGIPLTGSIRHSTRLGFPRIGRRRDDLRFVQDENVIAYPSVGADGDAFSQDITVIGNGEGFAAIAAGLVQRVAVPNGRVRRAKAISDPRLKTPGMVQRAAADEFRARTLEPNIDELTVVNHLNAPLSAIAVGDDIAFDYDTVHRGSQRAWLRVTSIEESADQPGEAKLKTTRSDQFQYASDINPSPSGEPWLVDT